MTRDAVFATCNEDAACPGSETRANSASARYLKSPPGPPVGSDRDRDPRPRFRACHGQLQLQLAESEVQVFNAAFDMT